MYIYSTLALVLVAYLAPHIRTQRPLECLALATFFVVDSVVNAFWTVAFGITWFLVVSEHHSANFGAGKTMSDAAGFTNPEHNVSSVEVVVGPDQGIPGEKQEAVTAGNPGSEVNSAESPSLGHGVLQPESMSSVTVICALWAVRIYLVLVVMSYARLVLRKHVATTSRNNASLYTGSKNATQMENPFAVHLPEGKGWKGGLGRLMVGLGKEYWLGVDETDESWMNNEIAMGRLRKREAGTSEAPGVVERERRRRSGTVRRGAIQCRDRRLT